MSVKTDREGGGGKEKMKLAELRVSAPGKVILFGEHSVVYGKTAVAASLNLRTTLTLKELSPEVEFCEIDMPGVGLSIRVPMERLQDTLLTSESSTEGEDEQQVHSRLLKRASDFAREHVDSSLEPRQKCSLECLFYALTRVARAENLNRLPTGFQLKLSTELPLGAGLGSSASFSVCLVAGFLLWARYRANPNTSVTITDQQSLRQVSRHAFGCEKIMHGAPSGVDNEICTFGSAIEFRKGEAPKLLTLAKLRVLLVDTKVARSTKTLVDKLAKLNAQYPEVYDTVFESIDRLCRRVVETIKDSSSEACRQLSDLVDINQGLLTTCQVSHPSIDSICATAKKHALSAKLTGAGGGGFVYVLVPPDTSADKLRNVTCELTDNGFSVIETNLGGSGLETSILYDTH